MKFNKLCRPLMVFFLVFTFMLCTTQVAYAFGFGPTPAESIDQYNEEVMKWYRVILRSFIFPMEIASFAICGVKLLFSGVFGTPQTINNVKVQILMSAAVLAVAIMLPTIIGWGVGMFQETGWKPPQYDFWEQEVTTNG